MEHHMWKRLISARARERKCLWFICYGITLFAQAHPALAADPNSSPSAGILERLDRLEQKADATERKAAATEKKVDAPAIWKALGLKLSGAVDLAYTHNFNNPNSDLNQLHIFDTNANAFMPHLAQVMIERSADAGGSALDRAGFRARLNFGLDARVTRARTNFQPGTSNNELDFQEVFAQYIIPIGNGLDVKFGKINTLIGYEVIQSWENPNFSRSFMFGLGQAFTTTGVRFTYQFNTVVLASVGIINGWDNVDDNNKGKSAEWLLALTPNERLGVSFYGSYGPEQPNRSFGGASFTPGAPGNDPSAKRLVSGAIITAKVTDKSLVVLEPYYANESNASVLTRAHNARWNGIAGYVIHDINDQWGIRLRGEIFEDAGGARTCGGTFDSAGGTNTCFGATNTTPAPPVAQTLWETTQTLQYRPVPSLITRIEFRYDKSNKNVFQYGSAPTNHQETLSFQVVYLF
jgi:hypothetical protein